MNKIVYLLAFVVTTSAFYYPQKVKKDEVGERLRRSDISNFKVGDLKYSDVLVLANEPSQSLKGQMKKTTKKSSSTKKKSVPRTKKIIPTTKGPSPPIQPFTTTPKSIEEYPDVSEEKSSDER
uniref:Secreted protein n=1 Tax=Parastrongyloides trichosuri TaxID=131310 RepID=A0A0N5A5M2_PARTI